MVEEWRRAFEHVKVTNIAGYIHRPVPQLELSVHPNAMTH